MTDISPPRVPGRARDDMLRALNETCGFDGYSGTLEHGVYEFYLPGRWSRHGALDTPYSVHLRLPECEAWVVRLSDISFAALRRVNTLPPTNEQADAYAARLRSAALLLA